MGSLASPFDQLLTLLPSSSYHHPSTPSYTTESSVWSTHRDLHPRIVIRPTTHADLVTLITFLSAHPSLSYNVRSRGFGSASASDVLISMTAFDSFEYDAATKTVVLGAGGEWGAFYEKMEKVAPKEMIVAARTPCIGVGGSTLCSGFSWLSHEYGCVSDEGNLLDAEVVLADGRSGWAVGELGFRDLMWAMRGTEGGFAVVTRLRFSVKTFEENGGIWGGAILLPRGKVREVASGIARMCARSDVHPKVALFLYVMRKEVLKFIAGGGNEDMLVVHAYDGLGEEHGRKEFAWALEIEGSIDLTKGGMTMRDVTNLQAQIGELKGTAQMFWTPMAVSKLSEDDIIRAFQWWDKVESQPNSVREHGYLLFELFSCRDNLVSRASSAWPRPIGFKHMLLIGAGCNPDAPKDELETAKAFVKDDGPPILGNDAENMMPIPNALEDFHSFEKIYGSHYERLREVKRKYDPNDRMGGWIRP